MRDLEFIYNNMSIEDAKNAMIKIIDMPDDVKISFLTELHSKGETPEEIAGFAEALRSKSKIKLRYNNLTDIVGTGGDKKNTINVSTAASILLSSMGVKIAKHGNFGITGKHGSADFMEYLNYNFKLNEEEIKCSLDKKNYVYILAPEYNDNFKKFANARKKINSETVFNILGPLTNPLNPDKVVLGSFNNKIAMLYSEVILKENKKGFIINSEDGMDEISPFSKNYIYYVDKKIHKCTLDPENIIDDKINLKDIATEDPVKSFEMAINGLKGINKKTEEFIAINAAPALILNGLSNDILTAYDIIIDHIDNKNVIPKLKEVFNYEN